ncbi:uncharacterized protein LOC111056649 [Nilaparvata lugens]|uniref:uncharacterized protein LOC111056649 n=1 Tax=Nilaparvata lugens TaxID=108931 RepID=UPI00193DBE9A|nr:uncharacterized protein LOC111056649 [Nilaparvata lugens]
MERRFSWDHEETIIEFVKNHSVLFDINHPEYRNSAHKQRLWRELATILNRSTEDVQKKWFNIRDYHKRKKKGPPGPSGGKPSQREEALSFLDGFFCVKKRMKIQHDEEELIIEFVKAHPPLFDINHPDYKNGKLKSQLWSQIARDLNKTVDDVKNRWVNIRDYHTRKKKGTGFSCDRVSYRDEQLAFLNCNFDKSNGNQVDDSAANNNSSADDQSQRDLQIALLKTLCERRPVEETPQPDMLERFFNAMCATVRAFPAKEQAEVKLKIGTIIGETELRLQEEAVNDSLLLL